MRPSLEMAHLLKALRLARSGSAACSAAPSWSRGIGGWQAAAAAAGWAPAGGAAAHAGGWANAHGTTVLCVRKEGRVVMIADGQVTMGSEVVKHNVRKVRRLGAGVVGGFAGATADAMTLFERLESRLEEHPGQLMRAAVDLAKAWRTDKYLRRLDAVMLVADHEVSLHITGNGDVLEPTDGVIGIGSGGAYATSAARALIDVEGLDAEAIARKAMKIAADSCIYTNHQFTVETLSEEEARSEKEAEEDRP